MTLAHNDNCPCCKEARAYIVALETARGSALEAYERRHGRFGFDCAHPAPDMLESWLQPEPAPGVSADAAPCRELQTPVETRQRASEPRCTCVFPHRVACPAHPAPEHRTNEATCCEPYAAGGWHSNDCLDKQRTETPAPRTQILELHLRMREDGSIGLVDAIEKTNAVGYCSKCNASVASTHHERHCAALTGSEGT